MMLTGDARLETVVAAVNRGEIFRFFIKPCNEVELIVSIRDALEMRELKQGASRPEGKARAGTDDMPAHDDLPTSTTQPIRLDDEDASHEPAPNKAPRPMAHAPEDPDGDTLDDGTTGSVFRLGSSEIDDNVDTLLDEISNELKKLDS